MSVTLKTWANSQGLSETEAVATAIDVLGKRVGISYKLSKSDEEKLDDIMGKDGQEDVSPESMPVTGDDDVISSSSGVPVRRFNVSCVGNSDYPDREVDAVDESEAIRLYRLVYPRSSKYQCRATTGDIPHDKEFVSANKQRYKNVSN